MAPLLRRKRSDDEEMGVGKRHYEMKRLMMMKDRRIRNEGLNASSLISNGMMEVEGSQEKSRWV